MVTEERQIPLTLREAQCLYFLLQGKTAKMIGKILKISYRTVEIYFDKLREKANARTRLDIIRKLKNPEVVQSWGF